jgi:hypothetical protein
VACAYNLLLLTAAAAANHTHTCQLWETKRGLKNVAGKKAFGLKNVAGKKAFG